MTDKKLLRLDLDAIAVRLERQPSRITNYSRISTEVFDEICAELKKMYEREDKLKALTEETIEALDGVDSLFREEVVGLLRELTSL